MSYLQKRIIYLILGMMSLSAFGADRPNIVWIFSDDHTHQAIGAYGGPLAAVNPTPHLDRLANEGMRFNRCYVGNSICAPSRATLLTGKHSHLNGKIDNIGMFGHGQQQFQKILQKNGYQTAMIGKIHLNGKMQGFDRIVSGYGRPGILCAKAEGLAAASEMGAKFIVQPGGSIRDDEVVAACNKYGIAMAMTNMRHFKH